MGVVSDVCRKITALTSTQTQVIDSAASVLGLAADLAHAQVTLYAPAHSENFLAIVAQAKPNTSYIDFKTNIIGSTVQAAEEPLIWRTLVSGTAIAGQREWALGMDALEMRVYPIKDVAGQVIAAASFETSNQEASADGHSMLVETANMLLTMAATGEPLGRKMYRPLGTRDGIVIIDERGYIIFANSAADAIYKVLGINRVIGRRVSDRQANMKLAQQAMSTGKSLEKEIEAGNMILVQRAIPIFAGGLVVRTVFTVADVTEIRKKEKELLIKSAVIQEIHHRVKNNLQTIASLLRLQARRTQTPEVKAALRESVNRILSISVVHEFLSQQDQGVIDVAEVTKNILDLVIQNMLEPNFNIETVLNGQTVILPSEQASSLALVINELIQNSIEHGFVGRKEGLIGVDIATTAESYQIDIYDDGIGLPEDFNLQNTNSLGLQIVRTLIENDLGGKFRLFSRSGTHAFITIPRLAEGAKEAKEE
ncbi:sensor histidine kinase [Sporomusa acidovorans]|uniref:histidine kinase n=1 Tax=Sporomusa acidovorans (strain ATCC 49682 / DSM 3132 / Mol) TaxID=1123286 RepID=A0ABZ3J0D3_SPOA4|nr:histidine kinase N-terminal domain-containing protein [Sporomusa acidovorans]OZC19175.1 putative sensor histidine kinase pdtaS [Sporomusa acidovorans DSM 3132]SDF11642.1 Two-component sensor histidine kinase, contains HisKA and HATPase domains [Sporomusa acidovorans]